MLEIIISETVTELTGIVKTYKADVKHLRARTPKGKVLNFGGKTMLCVSKDNRPYVFFARVAPRDQYCKKTGIMVCVNQFLIVMGIKATSIEIHGREIKVEVEN